MKIIYESKTGNVKRFIEKAKTLLPGSEFVRRSEILLVDEPFIMVTYTTGFGQIPNDVLPFLEVNQHFLRGVASSGNRNLGANFGKSGDIISAKFSVPLLCKFELSGTTKEVEEFVYQVNLLKQKAS